MTGKKECIRFVSVVGPKIKPYAAKDKNGSDIYIYDAELIRIIAKYFGACYEISTPPDGAYGSKLPDGNWTGMIGMIERKEADLAMSGIAVTVERFSAVHYSYSYLQSTLSFMTDAPVPLPKNLAIFHPFSYTLWMALAGLTMAMSIFFYVLLSRMHPYQKVLLSTVRSTLENTIDFKMSKASIRMAAIAWILGMFLVTSSYKAVLLSFLSFPTMIGIRDIPGLSRAASDPSFRCITFAGSYMIQDFARSHDPSWEAIGECLRRNEMPGDALVNFDAAPHGKAFVGSKLMTVPFERNYLVSEDDFYIEQYGIPFSHAFCCPEILNGILHRFTAAGIFQKLRREENFFLVLQTPSLMPKGAEATTKLALEDMSGAFYILIGGWILGSITLLVERLVRKGA